MINYHYDMKHKKQPAWKEAMISEIRRINAFIEFLKTIGPERVVCHNFAFPNGKRIKIKVRSRHFRVPVRSAA